MEKSQRRRKDRDTTTTSLDSEQQHSCLPQQLTMDLMMDIFSRLPLKSIAISRCVSKQWASVLAHPDFTDLRLTRSQTLPPRLLFACVGGNKVVFLSSPHPQSPVVDDEMSVAADHHMSFSFDHPIKEVSTSVNGFVCVGVGVRGYQLAEESVICNPSTGQSLTLPGMKKARRNKKTWMVRFLGYDPVEKLHKVLGMICSLHDRTKGHQVLTLGGGSENARWRMVECGIPCASYWDRHNLCIHGVFYYIELVKDGSRSVRMVICFDVRSDKFGFVKFPERNYPVGAPHPRLLDCNGKLGLVASCSLDARSERIVMWVLQDPERHEWSQLVFKFPPMWKDLVNPDEQLEIVGLTGPPGEFVMSSASSADPFHVYYCNFEKGTVTRAVIQGMGAAFGSGRRYHVRTFLNHVEDVKLMEL